MTLNAVSWAACRGFCHQERLTPAIFYLSLSLMSAFHFYFTEDIIKYVVSNPPPLSVLRTNMQCEQYNGVNFESG